MFNYSFHAKTTLTIQEAIIIKLQLLENIKLTIYTLKLVQL